MQLHAINATTRPVIIGLGSLGLVPFGAAGGMVLLGLNFPGLDPLRAFMGYSAVILSFLAGTLWGKSISCAAADSARQLLILSNLLALLAWLALMADAAPTTGLAALAAGYSIILWVERRYDRSLSAASDAGYQAMRNWLTVAVVIMHIVLIASLSWGRT